MQGSPQSLAAKRHQVAMPSGFVLSENQRWYAVQTQPRREFGAQIQLTNQGFRTFLPLHERTTRRARHALRTIGPLFPRYMFIALDLDRDRWRSVNGTFGVTGLVMTHDRPLPLRQGIVEQLVTSCTREGVFSREDDLIPGQTVRMVGGPFAQQLGVLQRLDERDRVCVLLQMMGSNVPVRMPRADVAPLN